MTTFAENWNLNEKDMYILVNKKPMNALNLKVSDIIKFNQGRLDGLRFADSIVSEAARKAKMIKIENCKSVLCKEGWFFTVTDDHNTICSNFYETEADAEEARDKLLLMTNKIIARLYKVEI